MGFLWDWIYTGGLFLLCPWRGRVQDASGLTHPLHGMFRGRARLGFLPVTCSCSAPLDVPRSTRPLHHGCFCAWDGPCGCPAPYPDGCPWVSSLRASSSMKFFWIPGHLHLPITFRPLDTWSCLGLRVECMPLCSWFLPPSSLGTWLRSSRQRSSQFIVLRLLRLTFLTDLF